MNIAADKKLHFAVGFAIYAVTCFFGGWKIAAVFVLMASVGKEVYDYDRQDKHTPDVHDILATVAGGLACAVVIAIGGLL